MDYTVFALTPADRRVLLQVVRQVLGEYNLPRQYPTDDAVAVPGGQCFRFTLREDVEGVAEDEYKAIIYKMDQVQKAASATLVDTYGWMASLDLRAGDQGLATKYRGKYYYMISDCGSIGDCGAAGVRLANGIAPPAGTVGTAYSWVPTTAQGTPTSWAATGLPAGLSIDPGTGEVSGTPTAAGSSEVVLTCSDGDSCTATRIVTFTIAAAP